MQIQKSNKLSCEKVIISLILSANAIYYTQTPSVFIIAFKRKNQFYFR